MLDDQLDMDGEEQLSLQWKKKIIIDKDNQLQSFFYVELESLELKKLDKQNTRPFHSAKICQLRFQIKIRVQ